MSWSSHRKFIYGGGVSVLLVLIIIVTVFSLFYKKPTCFDNIRNGGEQAVDCGGACQKLCQSAFLPAKIKWGGAKYEKVAGGLYNVASYIVNPNTDVAAVNVPYKFALFDARGILITERQGIMTLPAHRNVLAFEPAVDVGKRIPAKVTFEFLAAPEWFKSHDALDGLAIIDKKYSEDEKNSSLEVTLENRSLLPYKNITVSTVLYDAKDNAIGFSRTHIDELVPKADQGRQENLQQMQEVAGFTWPVSRQGRVTSIEVLPMIAPLRDR